MKNSCKYPKVCPSCSNSFCAARGTIIYCSSGCARPEKRIDNADVWFWKHVSIKSVDECWEWNGTKSRVGGYGRVRRYDGKEFVYAHRVAFLLKNGRYPNGLTRHKCDNKSCVNPSHLTEGTDADNGKDRAVRDRMPFGARNHAAKLTEEAVKFIRSSDMRHSELAKIFDVEDSTIIRCRNGKNWRRV